MLERMHKKKQRQNIAVFFGLLLYNTYGTGAKFTTGKPVTTAPLNCNVNVTL